MGLGYLEEAVASGGVVVVGVPVDEGDAAAHEDPCVGWLESSLADLDDLMELGVLLNGSAGGGLPRDVRVPPPPKTRAPPPPAPPIALVGPLPGSLPAVDRVSQGPLAMRAERTAGGRGG